MRELSDVSGDAGSLDDVETRIESAWTPAFAGVTVWGRLARGGILSWHFCSMGECVPGGTGSFYPWAFGSDSGSRLGREIPDTGTKATRATRKGYAIKSW